MNNRERLSYVKNPDDLGGELHNGINNSLVRRAFVKAGLVSAGLVMAMDVFTGGASTDKDPCKDDLSTYETFSDCVDESFDVEEPGTRDGETTEDNTEDSPRSYVSEYLLDGDIENIATIEGLGEAGDISLVSLQENSSGELEFRRYVDSEGFCFVSDDGPGIDIEYGDELVEAIEKEGAQDALGASTGAIQFEDGTGHSVTCGENRIPQ